MSEAAIFIPGIVVFAITVYGTVMAGGIAMNRIEIEQNPGLHGDADEERPDERPPATQD